MVNDFVQAKADEVAARIGARVVADPIDAINDPEVDAVLLATPGNTHAEQVNACLDAGKPVLCEKPLTTDVESSYAIVQKQRALGRELIQVGFMRRFDTEYAALRELITSGGLGQPLIVHCAHRNPAVPDHFNSEFMIRDSVVHEVDVARFLLGEEITSVQVIKGWPRSRHRTAPTTRCWWSSRRPPADRHRRDLRPVRHRVRGPHRGGRRVRQRHHRA